MNCADSACCHSNQHFPNLYFVCPLPLPPPLPPSSHVPLPPSLSLPASSFPPLTHPLWLEFSLSPSLPPPPLSSPVWLRIATIRIPHTHTHTIRIPHPSLSAATGAAVPTGSAAGPSTGSASFPRASALPACLEQPTAAQPPCERSAPAGPRLAGPGERRGVCHWAAGSGLGWMG